MRRVSFMACLQFFRKCTVTCYSAWTSQYLSALTAAGIVCEHHCRVSLPFRATECERKR